MRAPDPGAREWVTTTAECGLRIERRRWATPFARRVAGRIALNGTVDNVDAVVHDGRGRQWCAVRVSGGSAVVTDGSAPRDGEPGGTPTVGVDFPAGVEEIDPGVPTQTRLALTAALGCPTALDWVSALDDFWRQHGKDPGMPKALDVRDDQGRRHVVGSAEAPFEVHADGAVLGRVWRGDLLFDEALFGHLLRIVGGLADVSALIGATMREAYGGFES
jgi:hypothetical protein